jgi:spore coat polysaccharide biosynthesis protein SpsF (cytidylyltransferase family)
MRTAIFLSIREKATRLPKKVLRELHGKTVCEHLIDRLKLATRADSVVMTTSTNSDDTVLCDIADRSGITVFRGSEEDKLDRYLQAAICHDIDFMAIVDGDDLFISEEHIDEALAQAPTGADYVTHQGLPLGAACNAIRRDALAKVCDLKRESDTEVWGGYFTQTGLFQVRILPVTDPLFRRPDVRMTLDYQEDLDFFRAVFDGVYTGPHVPRFREIMSYLAAHPELVGINRMAQARYEANLAKAAPVRMAAERE